MSVVSLIIEIILVLVAVFLIIVVLMQDSEKTGVPGAIGGAGEAFFGKKKARGYEHKMNLFTTIASIGFMLLAIALVLIQKFGNLG